MDGVTTDISRAAYLTELIDALGGVIWEFDWSTGAFTFVSKGAERLLGFPESEWLRPGFWQERLHPDDAEQAAAYCISATKEGKDHEFEYRMLHADGSIVWVRDIVTVDPELRMEGALRGILLDITGCRVAEAERDRAERRYRSVLSESRLLTAEVDADGTVTFCNGACCELLGLDRDAILGRSFTEFIVGHQRHEVTESHRRRMSGESRIDVIPLTLTTADGGEREVRFHTWVLEGSDGYPEGAVVVGEDVTERTLLEGMLERKAEEFESIFRITKDLYFRMNAEGVFTDYMAPRRGDLIAPPEDFLGRRFRDVLPPEMCERVAEAIETAHASGQVASVEYGVVTLDGKPEHWEARVLPLSSGQDAVIARNISARHAREKALAESEERFRSMVELAPFGMHFHEVDEDGCLRFTGANQAAARILGIDYDGLVGLPLAEAFPGLDPAVEETYRRIARDGGTSRSEVTYLLGGEERVFDVTVFRSRPGQAVGTFSEVTQQRRAAANEAAYMDRLRAMATDLTASEDRERRRLAEELHDRVSQSLAVARMNLDAARAGDGDTAMHLDRARSLLEQAIAETRTVTTELAPPVLYELGLGPALTWLCDSMVDSYGLGTYLDIEFDESSLDDGAKMVLFRSCRELLTNVVKHSGTLHARVTLTSDGRRATLTVEDDGHGFDAGSAVGAGFGGFGLFSIRERLPHLGGGFGLTSSPGGGTTVTVSLPTIH